jgi:hypothetical protein
METKSTFYQTIAIRHEPIGFLPCFVEFVLKIQDSRAKIQDSRAKSLEQGDKQTSASSAPLKLKLTSHLTNRFN